MSDLQDELDRMLKDEYEHAILEVEGVPTGAHWLISEPDDGNGRARPAFMVHEDEFSDLFGSGVSTEIAAKIRHNGKAKLSLYMEVN